jgi:hypothetical protein
MKTKTTYTLAAVLALIIATGAVLIINSQSGGTALFSYSAETYHYDREGNATLAEKVSIAVKPDGTKRVAAELRGRGPTRRITNLIRPNGDTTHMLTAEGVKTTMRNGDGKPAPLVRKMDTCGDEKTRVGEERLLGGKVRVILVQEVRNMNAEMKTLVKEGRLDNPAAASDLTWQTTRRFTAKMAPALGCEILEYRVEEQDFGGDEWRLLSERILKDIRFDAPVELFVEPTSLREVKPSDFVGEWAKKHGHDSKIVLAECDRTYKRMDAQYEEQGTVSTK